MTGTETQFRESIVAEEILSQRPNELVNMLSLLYVFELAMPRDAISAVRDKIMDRERHFERAVVLRLLEVSQYQGNASYPVPRILRNLLPDTENSEVLE